MNEKIILSLNLTSICPVHKLLSFIIVPVLFLITVLAQGVNHLYFISCFDFYDFNITESSFNVLLVILI